MKWVRPAALAEVAEALSRGEIAVVPTETVYGLASTLEPSALLKVFIAKGRPEYKPLILGVADAEMARKVTAEWPDAAEDLAKRFWPGPLSLVLPKAEGIPYLVTAGGASVAVRAPAHHVSLELIRLVGRPLVLTSANRTGSQPPTNATGAVAQLGLAPAFVLDAGASSIGLASTVYDVLGDKVLREGSVTRQQLEGR